MSIAVSLKHVLVPVLLALSSPLWAELPAQESPLALLASMDASPHTRLQASSTEVLVDHEVGLGAMQKVSGVWHYKKSERLSGALTSYTWQVIDGFSSEELRLDLEQQVQAMPGASLLFSCDGRSCGHPTQWANRVFHQRVLYGKVDSQRYRVYTLEGEQKGRLVLYSSLRTADRQYLQAQWLATAVESGADQPGE